MNDDRDSETVDVQGVFGAELDPLVPSLRSTRRGGVADEIPVESLVGTSAGEPEDGRLEEVGGGPEAGSPVAVGALSDVEAAICSAGWPDCAKALRVARCESGDDYYSEVSKYHVGTFQIALAYHAERFMAHEWDIYTDGLDPYRNSVVAFEIWSEQGWGPWPYCGFH